jgi:predicted lipid-binding transport protein (Tim44 family)
MKRILLSIVMVLAGAIAMAPDADARRMGGGGSSGMKRDMPARTTPDATPAQPKQATAAPAQQSAAPAAAAGAASKRSWLGPIAGLAAGLGLAALMSHLGLGEEFANILMLMLLIAVAFFVVRWLMRRFGPKAAASGPQGLQFAGASAGASPNAAPVLQRTGLPADEAVLPAAPDAQAPSATVAPANVPPGFDTGAFERVAKLIFIRMQAANDAADTQDLRRFTTPEMFAAVQLDLQERPAGAQQTDVVQLEAQVIDVAEEDARQIVSVRFHGLIREQPDAPAEPFDEIWHLVRPVDGSREWAIAGIAQTT